MESKTGEVAGSVFPSDIDLVSSKPLGQANYGFQGNDNEVDSLKVKYTPNQDDHEVQIDHKNMPNGDVDRGKPYRGMGKEDLLYHSSTPFWRIFRNICLAIILLGWLALIIAVVALILVYPKCNAPISVDWWQKSSYYRVYVRSFMDSNGDGIGDLKGIESRLENIQELGTNVISISDIYESSGRDFDFDITNHTKISADYGTHEDFVSLLNSTHALGMFLILDFIPNHTSDQHPWFRDSQATSDRTNPKRNYYVWYPGNTPPNNWISVLNEPAWSSVTTVTPTPRSDVYLHQFRREKPELNLRNDQVRGEMEDILTYWLDLGVDGFYVRDSAYMFEDYDLRDETPVSNPGSTPTTDYAHWNHKYTYGLPEITDMFARWRSHLDMVGNATGRYRFLTADINGSPEVVASYYGLFERDGVDFTLNRGLRGITDSCNGTCVANIVDGVLQSRPAGKYTSWVLEDGETRLESMVHENVTKCILMLASLLPGSPMFYYGQELGMIDSMLPASGRQMPARSPMQWDNTSNAGFCGGDTGCIPWMDVNEDADMVNFMWANATLDSRFHFVKNLTALREQPAFQYGDFNYAIKDDHVFSFVRDYDGVTGYLVAVNFGSTAATRTFFGVYDTIPGSGTVEMITDEVENVAPGDDVSTTDLEIGPHQAIVLSWPYAIKEL